MIALLVCSTNLLGSNINTISSTGGLQKDSVRTDSVLISYDDLRKVNAKLIELEYERDINKHLRDICNNDSIIIRDLNNNIDVINNDCNERVRKVTRQRNVAGGIGLGAIILLIISIL